jgi:hypothetical protein
VVMLGDFEMQKKRPSDDESTPQEEDGGEGV